MYKWNDKKDKKLKEMIDNGYSFKEIAKELGNPSADAVRQHAHLRGYIDKAFEVYKWTDERNQQLKKLLDDGYSFEDIAKELDHPNVGSLRQHSHRMGYTSKKFVRFDWSEERLNLLKELVADGVSCDEIAKTLGVTLGAVRGRMKKLGITTKTAKREMVKNLQADWNDTTLTTRGIAKKYNLTATQLKGYCDRYSFGERPYDMSFLGISDIAECMGVSRKTVLRWLDQGLKYSRSKTRCKMYLIKEEDLLDFLERHQRYFNATKVDEFLFLEEPNWLKEKRKTDRNSRNLKRYTNDEDKLIGNMFQLGRSDEEIAEKLNRTVKAVENRRRLLGYLRR